ncbi:hypothetical protein HHL28_03190 [Aerophototrophica crusticola]|uniref:DUF3108 domain-containing protein n=1 Tax=Aerophototrophica crusticola TaxID=1709002 RepID=A0A858R4C5_9PROT|nr:hypothetical protein HHL28_03190 [Rhodospirillaceae bacterium B3]
MVPALSRRGFVAGAAGVAALGWAGLPGRAGAATIPGTGQIPFSVFRNGDDAMGYHRLRFSREGDRFIVDKEIGFEVKVAFITAYRYKHTNREVWQDGRLVSLDTRTNDDGDKHWVKGQAKDGAFAVESSRGSLFAPPDIIPTSYWNIATLKAPRLLDTQRGLLMDVAIDDKGEQVIRAGGQDIPARHHTIRLLTNPPGATNAIEIWYDRNDAWVKLAFKAKGQDIGYVLDPEGLVRPGQAAEVVFGQAGARN